MKFSQMIAIALAVTTGAGAGHAQQWFGEFGQGNTSAGVQSGAFTLRIDCANNLNFGSNDVQLFANGQPVQGSVTVSIDGSAPVALPFGPAGFSGDTPGHGPTFASLVNAIKAGQVLTVGSPAGTVAFPLTGAARALLNCPAPGLEAAAPPAPQTAPADPIRTVEDSLARLGFDPGPRDGQVDPALNQAIAAWQQATGRPATGGLSGEEFQALVAQAATAPESPAPAAAAQPAPASAGPVHVRIEECPFRRGFGELTYHRTGIEEQIDINLVTDFCFDESTGTLWGAETLENLTLVSQEGIAKSFEDLAGSSDPGSRTALTVGFEAHAGCEGAGGYEDHMHLITRDNFTAKRHPEAGFVSGVGYFFDNLVEPSSVSGPRYGILTLEFVSVNGERPFRHLDNQIMTPVISGLMMFSGGNATADVTGWEVFNMVELQGQVEAKAMPDGSLEVTGTMSAKNPRLAGHHPEEWLEMSYEIGPLKGYPVSSGNSFRTFGPVSGSYLNASGQTMRVNAWGEMEFVSDTC